MNDEQKRILELTSALGMALGALEVLRLTPYDFNQDGIKMVIDRIRAIVEKQNG